MQMESALRLERSCYISLRSNICSKNDNYMHIYDDDKRLVNWNILPEAKLVKSFSANNTGQFFTIGVWWTRKRTTGTFNKIQ